MRFEWDPVKAESNVRKHGVTFDEVATVFDDPTRASSTTRTTRLTKSGSSSSG